MSGRWKKVCAFARVAVIMEGTFIEGGRKAMSLAKLKAVVGIVLVAGIVGAGAAQEEKTGRRPEQGRGKPSILPPGLERLELNETQKATLARLRAELDDKLENAQKKLAAGMEQAKQNQDRQKAQEANRAFQQEITALQDQAGRELRQLLTEEQQRRLGELQQRGQPDPLRLLGQLELSQEQKEKVGPLVKEFNEKQQEIQKDFQKAIEQARANQDREKVREIGEAHQKKMAKLQEELHAALGQLLTEQQRQRLGELQRQRPGAGPVAVVQVLPPPLQERLGLSAEQREKLARLQQETEARLREILTEEQNRQVEQLRRGPAPAERGRPRE